MKLSATKAKKTSAICRIRQSLILCRISTWRYFIFYVAVTMSTSTPAPEDPPSTFPYRGTFPLGTEHIANADNSVPLK
jgi:hypothetical protein